VTADGDRLIMPADALSERSTPPGRRLHAVVDDSRVLCAWRD
jgi:hypothetical protein